MQRLTILGKVVVILVTMSAVFSVMWYAGVQNWDYPKGHFIISVLGL